MGKQLVNRWNVRLAAHHVEDINYDHYNTENTSGVDETTFATPENAYKETFLGLREKNKVN